MRLFTYFQATELSVPPISSCRLAVLPSHRLTLCQSELSRSWVDFDEILVGLRRGPWLDFGCWLVGCGLASGEFHVVMVLFVPPPPPAAVVVVVGLFNFLLVVFLCVILVGFLDDFCCKFGQILVGLGFGHVGQWLWVELGCGIIFYWVHGLWSKINILIG